MPLLKRGILSGWNTQPDQSGTHYAPDDTLAVQGNVTLYAEWNINSYTVTFKDWDGSVLKTQAVTYGGKATAPPDPDRTGYSFVGWSKPFNDISEDIIVTAEYEIDHYTVSFNTNGGSSVSSQSVAYLDSVIAPADPKKSGFLFEGWYTNSALSTPYDFSEKVTDDLTLYAKWTKVAEKLAQLTPEKAFQFAYGDTWECVTEHFVLLSTLNDAPITWASSDEDVISIRQDGSGITGVVTRPQNADTGVVITATVTEGSKSFSKTFLLIVAKDGASKNITRTATERTASVQAGDNVENEKVYRTTLDDKTNIDLVMLTSNTAQTLIDREDELDHIIVAIDNDTDNPADEFAFEVAADTISILTEKNLGLTLDSPEGSVMLSAEELKRASNNGMALYFRLVPVPNESEEAREAFKNDHAVLSMINGATSEILGVPRILQTNMEGFKTTVRFPLDGIDANKLSNPDFLTSLCIYAEHDNGTTELIDGVIIYEDAMPSAIEFEVSRFSRFQIVSVDDADSPWLMIGLCIVGGIILSVLAVILTVVYRRKRNAQTE